MSCPQAQISQVEAASSAETALKAFDILSTAVASEGIFTPETRDQFLSDPLGFISNPPQSFSLQLGMWFAEKGAERAGAALLEQGISRIQSLALLDLADWLIAGSKSSIVDQKGLMTTILSKLQPIDDNMRTPEYINCQKNALKAAYPYLTTEQVNNYIKKQTAMYSIINDAPTLWNPLVQRDVCMPNLTNKIATEYYGKPTPQCIPQYGRLYNDFRTNTENQQKYQLLWNKLITKDVVTDLQNIFKNQTTITIQHILVAMSTTIESSFHKDPDIDTFKTNVINFINDVFVNKTVASKNFVFQSIAQKSTQDYLNTPKYRTWSLIICLMLIIIICLCCCALISLVLNT